MGGLPIFSGKYHVPDTMVNARNTGMNIAVLAPACMEPGERGECYTGEHIVTNMESVVKVKQDAMKSVKWRVSWRFVAVRCPPSPKKKH